MAVYKWEAGTPAGTYILKWQEGDNWNDSGESEAVATLTGLKDANQTLTAPTSESYTTITLTEGMLGDNDISISGGYTLALNDGTNNVNQLGGTVTEAAWDYSTTSGSAIYKSESNAKSWKVENGQIKFIQALEATSVVTVSGLKSDASTGVAFDASDGTKIIVSNDALPAAPKAGSENSVEISVSPGDGGSYTLELGANVTTTFGATDETNVTVATGTATVKRTQSAGFAVEQNKIVYKAEQVDTLATITNLKADATTGVTLGTGANEGKIILAADALDSTKTETVTLDSDGQTNGYTLALDATLAQTAKDKAGSATVTVNPETGTATIKRDTAEYWTTVGTTVTYNAEVSAGGSLLANISGLASTASASNITVDGNVVTLKGGANGAFDATHLPTLTNQPVDGAMSTLTLALSDVNTTAKDAGTVTTTFKDTDANDNNSAVKATIKKNLKEYWTVDNDTDAVNPKVVYHKASTEGDILAEITGLKSTAAKENVVVNENASTTEITLKADALGETNVTLDNKNLQVNDSVVTYSLILDGEVTNTSTDDGTASLKHEGTTVTVYKKKKAYWTLTDSSGQTSTTKVKYHPAAQGTEDDDKLATITNLASSGVVIEGDDANVILDYSGKTVTLKEAALSQNTDNPTTFTADNSSNYTLELGSDVNTTNNKDDATGIKISVNGGKAQVKAGKAAYWTESSGIITYTAMEAGAGSVLAEVSGLNTTDATTTDGSATVLLDTTDNKIKLKQNALATDINTPAQLTNKNITIGETTYAYTLEFDGDVQAPGKATSADPTLTVSNETTGTRTATIKQAVTAGWTLDENAGTITYTTPEAQTIATITGLSTSAAAENVKLGTDSDEAKLTVTLQDAALGAGEIKLTNEASIETADMYYQYKLALASNSDNDGEVGFDAVTEHWEVKTDNNDTKYLARVSGIQQGWTLKTADTETHTQTISYTPEAPKEFAKITGLVADLEVPTSGSKNGKVCTKDSNGVYTEVVTFSNNIITLKAGALTTSATPVVLTNFKNNSNAEVSYTLALDTAVIANAPGQLTNVALKIDDTDKTKALVTGNITAGYTLDTEKKQVTYSAAKDNVTFATVTGLKDGFALANVSLAKVTGAAADDSETVIKLKTGALGTTDVTLTNSEKSEGVNYRDYVLAFDATTNADGTVGFDNADATTKYWTTEAVAANSTTTAKYQYDVGAGWTLDTKEESTTKNRKITYTAATIKTLATITGLKAGLEAVGKPAALTGITVTEPSAEPESKGSIQLSKDVLSADAAVKISLGAEDKYNLTLNTASGDGQVPIKAVTGQKAWEINADGTATLYQSDTPYWTLHTEDGDDKGKITYTAETNKTTLATVSGLKKNLNLSDADITANLDITTADVIKLGKAVLGTDKTTNAVLTNEEGQEYTLALNTESTDDNVKVTELDTSNGKWTVDGTTAKFSGTVSTDSYELTADNTQVKYTAAAGSVEYAKIEGLASGLVPTANGKGLKVADTEDTAAVVSLDSNGGKAITLKHGALGTATATTTLTGTNYTLSLEGTEEAALADSKILTADCKVGAWRIKTTDATNGDTAEYKNVTLAYYTLAGDNKSVTCTAEVPDNTTVQATVKGIKSGLSNVELNKQLTFDTSDANNPKILVGKGALGTTDVTLTNASGKNFKLALNTTSTDDNVRVTATLATQMENPTWSFDSATKTATYSGTVKDGGGYEVASDTSIEYSKAGTKTFATVTGLNADLTVGTDDNAGKLGITSGETFTEALTLGTGADAQKITLSKGALGGSNVTVTGTNYTLALDATDGVGKVAQEAVTAKVWRKDGTTPTTAAYKTVALDYYTLDTGATSVTYHPEVANNSTIQATLTGLANVSNDVLNANITRPGDATTGGITLSKVVLGTTDVALTNKAGYTYNLALDASEDTSKNVNLLNTSDGKWSVATATNGTTTATFAGTVAENSYELTGNDLQVKYFAKNTDDTKPTIFATLTGLNADLKASTDGSKLIAKDAEDTAESVVTIDTSATNRVITLLPGAFTTSNVTVDGTNYTIAIGTGVKTTGNTDAGTGAGTAAGTKPNNEDVWRISGTTATYKTVTPTYYTQETNDKTNIKYNAEKAVSGSTKATLTGLKANLTDADLKANIKLGNADSTFTLGKDILGTTDVELKNATGQSFKLALADENVDFGNDGNADADKKVNLLDTTGGKWSVNGTTATFAGTVSANSYELTGGDLKVKYFAKNEGTATTTFATLTGLKAGLVTDNDGKLKAAAEDTEEVIGLDNNGRVITLKAGALGNSNVTVSGTNYTLDLYTTDGKVKTTSNKTAAGDKPTDEDVWRISGTTATYKTVTPVYYTLDDNKVTYHAEADVNKGTLATVKGLKQDLDLTDEQITANLDIASGNTIKLGKAVLGTTDVTLTNAENQSYTLALNTESTDDDVKVTATADATDMITGGKWTVSGNTATYTGTVATGGFYEALTDGSQIKYTGAGDNVVLAKVSGLNSSNIMVDTAEGDTKDKIFNVYGEKAAVVAFDESDDTNKTIKLSAAALGNSGVTVTGTNYKLALDEDVTTQSTATAKKVWRISGTTATYKEVTPAYYTLGTGETSVTYEAEKTNKTGTGTDAKDKIYATITGLKSGLMVATVDEKEVIGTYSADKTTFTPGVDVATTAAQDETKKAITLKKNVLDTSTTKTVTITSDDYKLALCDDTNDTNVVPTPVIVDGTAKWTVSGTTAKYVGKLQAGWTLKDDKITYSGEKTNFAFATVEGLKSGLKVSDITDESVLTLDTVDDVITLNEGALGNSNVEVTTGTGYVGTAYTLALDEDVTTQSAATAKNVWRINGTTATYSNITPAYYTQETSDKTKVTYHAEAINKDNSGKEEIYATFKGLKSGLTIGGDDDEIIGIDNGSGTVTGISVSGREFTVTEAALNKADAKITLADGYTVTTDFDAEKNLHSADPYWQISSGKLFLKQEKTAGYALVKDKDANEKVTGISYTGAKTITKATVDGLNLSGLKVISDTGENNDTVSKIGYDNTENPSQFVEVLTIDATKDTSSNAITAGTIEIKDSIVLKNDNVTLDKDSPLTLTIGEAYDTTEKPTAAWVVEGTKAALVKYHTKTYMDSTKTDEVGKVITYTPATIGDGQNAAEYLKTTRINNIDKNEILATVDGIKSGLKVDDDGQLTALTIGEESVITVGVGALNRKNITIASESYTLALDTAPSEDPETGHDYVEEPKASSEWAFDSKKGIATYTNTTAEGYKVDSRDKITNADGDTVENPNKDKIIYYSPKSVATATISGLKTGSTISVSSDKQTISGITYEAVDETGVITSDEATGKTTKVTNTFTLDTNILDKKTVSVATKGAADFTLAVKGSDVAPSQGYYWDKTAKTTKAIYKEGLGKGYTLAADEKKITYSAAATTKTLATVNGLLKTAVPSNDGNLPGVTVTRPADTDNPETADVDETIGVIQLDNTILTASNVTLGKNDNYILKLDNSQSYDYTAHSNDWWTVSKGTANLLTGMTASWTAHKQTKGADTEKDLTDDKYDDKTIYYTKPTSTVIAKVTGLDKTLTANADGTVTGLTHTYANSETGGSEPSSNPNVTASSDTTEKTGTINLTKAILTTGTVKLTVPKTKLDTTYTFTLAIPKSTDDDYAITKIDAPTDKERKFKDNGKGTLTYQYITTDGYNLNDAANQLVYTKEKTTVLATLAGLNKTGKVNEYVVTELEGISFAEAEDNTETTDVNESLFGGTFTFTSDKLLLADPKNNSKVTLKNSKGYTFALKLADDLKNNHEEIPEWTVSKGTATLKEYNEAGYALSAADKNGNYTATYKTRASTNTLVTIKGLDKTKATLEAVSGGGVSIDQSDVITLGNVVGTSTVSLTQGKKWNAETQKADIATAYQFDASSVTAPLNEEAEWTYNAKKGTASLTQVTNPGFTPKLDKNELVTTLTYNKQKTTTLATLSGLSTELEINKVEGNDTLYVKSDSSKTAVVSFNETDKLITVAGGALDKKNVTIKTLKGENAYKLEFGEGVPTEAVNTTEWVVSDTTATYKNYDKGYYSISEKNDSIVYTKDTAGTTYATVKNLKSGADLSDSWKANNDSDPTQGGVLTLGKAQLGEKTVTLTTNAKTNDGKDMFTLALDITTKNEATESTMTPKQVTADGKGKATLQATFSKGFYAELGGKTLTYYSAAKTENVGTVTGLKAGAKIKPDNDGIITLESGQLNGKNVTVTTTKGAVNYTLATSGFSAPTVTITNNADTMPKEPGWTNPKGTGTLKGYVTAAGYTLSDSGTTTLTYTAATAMKNKSKTDTTQVYKDSTTFASVKGLEAEAEPTTDATNKTIAISGSQASGNLTVNGGVFKVSVDSNFNNKAITGSAAADYLTVGGSGVTVTAGKGDDYVDLGSGTNRFVYSNGEGNDVVENFTAGTDTLQIKSGAISVGVVGSDTIVRVGTGSITLKDYTAPTLTILNGKDAATTYAVARRNGASGGSNVAADALLADDNYSLDAASLSDIVKPAAAQYTPYDFTTDFSLTKEKDYAPVFTYSDKK